MIAVAGAIVLIFNQTINGLEGFAMGIGVAGSILLLNVLYRVGLSGDRERDEEEAARVYFDEHGRWPGETVDVLHGVPQRDVVARKVVWRMLLGCPPAGASARGAALSPVAEGHSPTDALSCRVPAG